MIKTLFMHLMQFREISPLISKIYRLNCYTYNFAYLHDCVKALEKFILQGWPTGDLNLANTYLSFFGQEEAVKIFDVVKVLVEEVKKGSHDLYQVNHGEVNLEQSLTGLIEKFIKVHSGLLNESSAMICSYLSQVLEYFRAHLHEANYNLLVQGQVNADTIMDCVQVFNIKCMDALNYPNGDNKLLSNIKKQDMNFIYIKRMVTLT